MVTSQINSQVDSLELPEMMEMTENFTKVTKYLTKFKETINYVNNFTSKSSKNNIFRGFHVFKYVLWQKTKTWKCQKSTESFLNPRSTQY